MILKHISIDTNILNYCLDERIEASVFNCLLKNNGYTPLLVPHVLYECTKCFVDKYPENQVKKTNIDRGKQLFCYIKDLNPDYGCQRNHLYKMECDNIMNGREISYLAGKLLRDIIQGRIYSLCLGDITKDLRLFVLE